MCIRDRDWAVPCDEECLYSGFKLFRTHVGLSDDRQFCSGEYLYYPGSGQGVCKLDHRQRLYDDPGTDGIHGRSGHCSESRDVSRCV